MKIWLDDERPAPEGWVWCQTATCVCFLIEKHSPELVSLDHDLGLDYEDGYTVIEFLEQKVHDDPNFHMPIIHIHTANPPARERMISGLASIHRYIGNVAQR